MQWYYVKNNQRLGPFDERAFGELAAQGEISDSTLVWNADLPDWTPFSEVNSPVSGDTAFPAAQCRCAECGELFPWNQVTVYHQRHVCGRCQPIFFRRVLQGTLPPVNRVYAGIWRRAGAKLIDWMILAAFQSIFQTIFYLFLAQSRPELYTAVGFIAGFIGFVANIAFNTYFIGRFAATPGKMACGLKVIMPGGGKVSYARALGRAAGEFISGAAFYIGYLVAIFDEQRRALHDFFCDTRVVQV